MGTSLHPIAIVLLLFACILIFRLPRERVIIPFLCTAIFIPLGQAVLIGGVHFYFVRILVLCGWARVLIRNEHRGLQWTVMDKLIVTFHVLGIVTYSIHRGVHDSTMGAVFYRVGVAITALGSYSMARFFIRDLADVKRLVMTLAVIALLVSGSMLVEHRTGRNMFSVFGGVFANTLVRNDRLRCTGPFMIHILAGTFGASLIPLFWGLWWQGSTYRWYVVAGMCGSLVIVITCASSGPILTLTAGVAALFLWPLRLYMRRIRWGIVIGVVGLHLVMKAPIWSLLARMNVLSASTGYHRFVLVDEFIRNYGEWWLIGMPRGNLADWGFFGQLIDITNEFVAVGVYGGLLSLVLFIVLIGYGFAATGRAMRVVASDRGEQKVLWALGASLFSHIVSFLGVGYSDQIVVMWYVLLGTLSAMSVAVVAASGTAKMEIVTSQDLTVATSILTLRYDS